MDGFSYLVCYKLSNDSIGFVVKLINKMCKFNGHLWVFEIFLLSSFLVIDGSPVKERFFNLNDDYDADIVYDQRQKGEENVRLRINGVIIAAAPPDYGSDSYGPGGSSGGSIDLFSGSPSSGGTNNNMNEYLDLLAFLGANKPSDSSSHSGLHQDDNHFLELLEYFPFKKRNSNTKDSVKEETIARNKIAPSSTANSSEKQLDVSKDSGKDEPRK